MDLRFPETPSRIACIGSRRLTQPELDQCFQIGYQAAQLGHTVVSGLADGADQAFMFGASEGGGRVVAVLPWGSYNRNRAREGWEIVVYDPKLHARWWKYAKLMHPAWDRCSPGAQSLHARNTGILLGTSPSERVALVIAYPSANRTGGTEQGMRLACAQDIPLANLRGGPNLSGMW